MAKIKIKGYPEVVQVPNDEARITQKLLQQSETDVELRNKTVVMGDVTCKLRDITTVVLTEEAPVNTQHSEMVKNFHEERDRIMSMTPRQKAENNAWAHFRLFYAGVMDKDADEKYKDQVIEQATKFFEAHPYWTVPSVRCWYALFADLKEKKMHKWHCQVLERIEETQLINAYQLEKFYEGQQISPDFF